MRKERFFMKPTKTIWSPSLWRTVFALIMMSLFVTKVHAHVLESPSCHSELVSQEMSVEHTKKSPGLTAFHAPSFKGEKHTLTCTSNTICPDAQAVSLPRRERATLKSALFHNSQFFAFFTALWQSLPLNYPSSRVISNLRSQRDQFTYAHSSLITAQLASIVLTL